MHRNSLRASNRNWTKRLLNGQLKYIKILKERNKKENFLYKEDLIGLANLTTDIENILNQWKEKIPGEK